jgi:hypothetical protein
MMLSLLLLLAAQNTDAMLATAQAITTAEPKCTRSSNSTDITVCGLRQADRYRVPFVVHDPGDRRYESVAAERERLTHRKNVLEEAGAILVETGMSGVSMTRTIGGPQSGDTVVTGYRKPAP